MNIGISVPLPAYKVDVVFMALQAEALGFESFWYTEHPSYQYTAIAEAVMR